MKIILKCLALATPFHSYSSSKKTQFLVELKIYISVTEHQHPHSVGEVFLNLN